LDDPVNPLPRQHQREHGKADYNASREHLEESVQKDVFGTASQL
jgi:hypothetical protein